MQNLIERLGEAIEPKDVEEDELTESVGKELLFARVDRRGLIAATKVADDQTKKLLREVQLKLIDELTPKNKGVENALNRLSNLSGSKKTEQGVRNTVFKVADELGMKLPAGSF